MTVHLAWAAVCSAIVLTGATCRSDVPAAAVPAGDGTENDVPAQTKAAAGEDDDGPARELWFSDGPGRDAILARERRDFDTARAKLDELLADASLSVDERGAAQWLRGLEDLRTEHYAAAADRFAEAVEAPALQPVKVRLHALEAQARLDASDPAAALETIRVVPNRARKGSPLVGDFIIMEADALWRTDDLEGAAKRYRAYVRAYPKGRRAFEAKAKLARLLAASKTMEDLADAVELYEGLLLEAPLSDYGEEAARELPALRKQAGEHRTGKAAREFQTKVDIGLAEANLDRRRYRSAIVAADKLLRRGKLDAAGRCKLLYVKGSAIFKRRKRAAARPVFEKATAACKSDRSLRSYEVKSRYQAARGRYAEGQYAKAAKAFEALATDHADHSYADDAWILAGESWAEGGDEKRAGAAYEAALKVDGDMADEARRRLLVQAFAAKDYGAARAICDRALKGKVAHPTAEAKLHYFRGRALQELGKGDEARAAWRAALQSDPLGYPAMQAMSRLRDAGEETFAAALKQLERDTAGDDGSPTGSSSAVGPPTGTGAKRALILARLGLGEAARQELDHADIDGWPAVAVLDQAGLYSEAQRLIANVGRRWRTRPPVGTHRRRWELAHPLPFSELVRSYEESHGVPPLLTWAVMKTESRYNPGATSWAGARGLIQLMPGTAKSVAKSAGVELADDALYDPATNLDLGMRYLAKLVGRYDGGDGAVALAVPSYNAGAGAVDRWLGERGGWDLDLFIESIPYDETRHYTQRVLGRWWAYRWLYGPNKAEDRVPYLPEQTPEKAER